MINKDYVFYYCIVGCLSYGCNFWEASGTAVCYRIFTELFLILREFAMHDIIYDGTCVKKKKD